MTTWLNEYFDAWNRYDAEGVAGWMTDDVDYEDMAFRHRSVGKQAIVDFVKKSEEVTPGASFELVTTFAADDHYYAEWIMQPLGVPGVSVGTLRDGKIATNRDYWSLSAMKDKMKAARAAGR
jgi:ketosteroid isomerase-like protein